MPDLNIIPSSGSPEHHNYMEREADRDRAPSNRAMVPITPAMLAWLDATGAEMGRRMVAADQRLAARRGGTP
jgi:hypothetical protein